MRKVFYILLLFAFVFVACDDEFGIKSQSSDLVVEGWIQNNQFPVVILTRTLPVTSEFQEMDNLEDYIVNWAKVSITDGTDTVVLTGKYDEDYFPPYIYTTGRMRGETGKSYKLMVDYKDFHASAVTTIPPTPQLDSFKVERVPDVDSLFRIKVYFTDNPNEKNYYQLFTRVGTKYIQYTAAYLGSINDEVIGEHTEVMVYNGHRLDTKKYSPYFNVNDTVAVKLAQVNREGYLFWDQYTKTQSLSTNMFLSTVADIPSNVSGGIGYWNGYGAVELFFVMSDYYQPE